MRQIYERDEPPVVQNLANHLAQSTLKFHSFGELNFMIVTRVHMGSIFAKTMKEFLSAL